MPRKGLIILKYSLLIAVIIFVYSFSNNRNSKRNLQKIEVNFQDESTALITRAMVNKLLIQNEDSIQYVDKEILDLNELEGRLNKHPMINSANVFLSVDGVLGARIEQRRPIARVAASPSYYIDQRGTKMPLSSVHTLRVPLVTGVTDENIASVTRVVNHLINDPFMLKHVVGIDVKRDQSMILLIRSYDFRILLGQAQHLERKFQNFKAFYQKTIKDKTLENYSLINLQVNGQVVATKK